MRALLSLLLCVCLLVSSVSPSVAQIVPGAGKLSRAAKMGDLSSKVTAALKKRTFLPPAQIRELVHSGRFIAALDKHILAVPSMAERTALLRKEFVAVALNTPVLPESMTQALKSYRSGVSSSALASFESFAGQDFRTVLVAAQNPQSAASQTWIACRNALSDAGALALFGSKEDASKLTAFYAKTKGTAFEDVAAAITARGLLRYGAYEELTAWAKENAADTYFWSELSAYAEANGLPVELTVSREAAAQKPSRGMTEFLRQGMEPNALNADFSRTATEKWMALQTKKTGETVQPAAQEAAAPAVQQPTVDLSGALASVKLPSRTNLTLSPVELGKAAAQPEAVAAVESAKPAPLPAQPAPAVKQSSNAGILYCGLPVFTMIDTAQRAYRGLVNLFKKKKAPRTEVPEEPGLHENTVRPVYAARRVSTNAETDAWINDMSAVQTEVSEDGFKLTVEGQDGVENILRNVDISISSSISTKGYNRVVLNKKNIFELRNLELAPGEMDHFFFKLDEANGAVFRLGEGSKLLNDAGTLARPLRIKLEKAPNRRYHVATLPVYNAGANTPYMTADVDASLLPSNKGYLEVDPEGNVWFVDSSAKTRTALKDYYVRLPKEDSKYWTKIMQRDGNPFSLQIYSTSDKTTLLTMSVPSLQIGLGKTLAPELKSRTELGESSASMIMLGINNVLPVLMGFVHPLLKRYGEAAVARWGMGFFVAGGVTALASGLYGGLGANSMTDLQTAAFILSSVLIATGTNITRFVQNILISANRGKIVPTDSFKKKEVEPGEKTVVPDMSYLWQRAKEVAKLKKGAVRDGALFQTASMFKNLGTMVFLMFPWLVNEAGNLIFGTNPGLDFSASYVPYTLWAGYSAWKLSKTAYKDAFPMNVTAVENQFKEMLAQSFDGMSALPAHALSASSKEMTATAKKINGMINSLTAVEVRNKKGDGKKLTAQHEAEAVEALEKALTAQGMDAAAAKQAGAQLQKTFDALGHRDVKLMDVLKLNQISPSLLAMVLATLHELSVSNGFAFAMHHVLGKGTMANALTALVLYGSMSGGRILGNLASRHLSGGSMYALSSAFSIGGTGLMATAGDNISQLIAGAVIASFGVGNFFSQMYEYMTGLFPKYKREISLLINYTMPIAAIMSFPMRWLVNVTGIPGIDLAVAGAAVTASVLLTPGMLRNSTPVQVAKYEGARVWQKIKGFFTRGGNNNPGNLGNNNLDDAAPAH